MTRQPRSTAGHPPERVRLPTKHVKAVAGPKVKGPGRARLGGIGRLLPTVVVLLAMAATALTFAMVRAGGDEVPSTPAEQAHQIASGVRCPVCRDLSAADSPAPMAAQMRQQVAQQLAAGRSADQIRAGFVAAYGESVLMSPPHTGLGQTAYLLPFLLMGGGLVSVVLLLRRWRRPPGPDEEAQPDIDLSPSDRRTVEQALLRLRELEGR